MFAEIADNQEDYKKFYEQFSKNLKLDEPQNFASRIHSMIKLGLSIFEEDKAEEDDDLPPLEDDAEEVDTNMMEKVDWSH